MLEGSQEITMATLATRLDFYEHMKLHLKVLGQRHEIKNFAL